MTRIELRHPMRITGRLLPGVIIPVHHTIAQYKALPQYIDRYIDIHKTMPAVFISLEYAGMDSSGFFAKQTFDWYVDIADRTWASKKEDGGEGPDSRLFINSTYAESGMVYADAMENYLTFMLHDIERYTCGDTEDMDARDIERTESLRLYQSQLEELQQELQELLGGREADDDEEE